MKSKRYKCFKTVNIIDYFENHSCHIIRTHTHSVQSWPSKPKTHIKQTLTFLAHKNSSSGATKCRSRYFVILLVKSNLAISTSVLLNELINVELNKLHRRIENIQIQKK